MRDIFSVDHTPFVFSNDGLGTDFASTANTSGILSGVPIQYVGNDLGAAHFQISRLRVGTSPDYFFQWEANAPPGFDALNIVGFHESGNNAAVALMAGADQINGSAGNDYLEGYAGNDTLVSGGGADTIDGGGGTDTADYSSETQSIYLALDGPNPVPVFIGGVVQGSLVNVEYVTAGGGDDAIVGNSGVNVLTGGNGDDYLFSNSFNPDGTIKSSLSSDTLIGGAGDDGLFGSDGNDLLDSGAGVDSLVGGGGNDQMGSGSGDDFVFGGAFSALGDRLANSGNDTIAGGDGNDALYGFDGDDTLDGGADNDYIEGGDGADTIRGGAGNDYLQGEAGDDIITSGRGFDYAYGGLGADTFVFFQGDSADWILDFKALEGDKLWLRNFGFADFAAVPLVDLSTPGNPAVQLTVTTGGETDQLTVFGVTLAQLNATNVILI